jgi:hypothetical protein
MRRSSDGAEHGLRLFNVVVIAPRDIDHDTRRWPRPGPAPEAPPTTGVQVANGPSALGIGVEVGEAGGGELVGEEGVHRRLLFVRW